MSDEATWLMGGPISAGVELIRFVGGPRDGETRYVRQGTQRVPWVGPAAWYLVGFGQQAERFYWRSESRRNDGEPAPFMWDGA